MRTDGGLSFVRSPKVARVHQLLLTDVADR